MSEGIGWLPVEARDALDEEQDKLSHEEAEALLGLPPREVRDGLHQRPN